MKTLLVIALLFTFFPLYSKTYQLIDQKGVRFSDQVRVSDDLNALTIKFRIAVMDAVERNIAPVVKSFQDLTFSKLRLTKEPGLAGLPFYSVVVKGIPSQFQVSVKEGVAKEFKDFHPMPTSNLKLRCGENCSQENFDFDWSPYYVQDRNDYSMDYIGAFRGNDLTRITFYPANYSDNRFEIFPQMEFSVTKKTRGKVQYYSDSSQIILENDRNDIKYLILSPEKYHRALQDFISWKRGLGYKVDLISLEDVGNRYSNIRNYLHGRYEDEATRYQYALLVGDEKGLVTGYVNTENSSRTPSDLGYFTMDGSDDFVADVFYGRMVVTTEEHVRLQSQKIIEYERGDFDSDPALYRQLGIASNEGYRPSDKEYVEFMIDPFLQSFDTEEKYILESGGGQYYDYVNPNVYLSEGLAWINYIGHGTGYSWQSMDRSYHSSYVKNIEPGKMKPVVIDVACLNGDFKYTGRMLGERFMNSKNRNEPVGAVAYYGASVATSWDPPAIMAIGISRMITKYNLSHIGEALLGGQLFLYQNHSNVREVISNMSWYHLFGDPSLRLRVGDKSIY